MTTSNAVVGALYTGDYVNMGFLKRHKVPENGYDDRRLRADVMELEPISQKIGIFLLRSGSIEASRRVEHDKRIRDMREKEYPQLKGT